ncbi:winged helix-turn-helix transcriptional regulator [Candidatus Woesearchaeota archaeon]|nr:winged helix-turn-helix transcriptional regulator [Candidatus Woesearchaeota archaeon]
MDLETLLTGTKWEIIEILANKPTSPLELAKKLNTTIANISQQLRLLQTANLIKKQRTGSAKPGKPRMLFSLSDNYAFITVFSKGFAKKKLIRISKKQKEVLKQFIKD